MQVSKLNEPAPWNRPCQCNYGATADKIWGKTENGKVIKKTASGKIFQCSKTGEDSRN